MAQCSEQAYLDNLQTWVNLFNATKWPKAEGEPDCQVCGNKRLVAFVRNGYRTMRDCVCAQVLRNELQLKASGMYDLVLRCGFENFQTDEPWQKALAHKVSSCLDTENWLLLCGQSGCGKTHLAAALCRALLDRGQQVLFMSWPRECHRLCAAWFDFDLREQLLLPFLQTPVLLLDDLFKTRRDAKGQPDLSRQEQDAAFELIERRYREGKRTIITTEWLTGHLRQLNEGLFGRIKERTGQFAVDISYNEQRNHRLATA